jgi:hypothetical protein
VTKMIPSRPTDGSPPGELALFAALANAPDTDDWVAIQGLQLAQHPTRVMGEIDFVVLVPSHGILVIEVKSHRTIARDPDGRWRLGADRPTDRGPFKQALDEKFALLDWLKRQGIRANEYPIWHAVWFTALQRENVPASPEWSSWEVLDARDLQAGVAPAILNVLARASRVMSPGAVPRIASAQGGRPTVEEVARVLQSLRGAFEVNQSVEQAGEERRNDLAPALREQLRVLDYLRNVSQVIVRGAAGTGKTHVAMEAARRAALAGRSTILIVFNRLLAEHIASLPEMQISNLAVRTMHSMLLTFAGGIAPAEAASSWWNETLPQLAIEAIANDPDFAAPFDQVVVDEAQDLVSEVYMEFLDLVLKGGLAHGFSLFAGDFEHQNIYGFAEAALQDLQVWQPNAVTVEMAVNCRSTRSIGMYANLMCSLEPPYEEFRRADRGVDPQLVFLDETQDFGSAVAAEVQRYLNERYAPSEIVILSPRRPSYVMNPKNRWLHDRVHVGLEPAQRVRIGTVHEFKGLEAPVVILTDFDETVRLNVAELFYIGVTRATHRLSVIARKSLMQSIVKAG